MGKGKYSLKELMEVNYHKPQGSRGTRAFLVLHRDRKLETTANRNDFELNKPLVEELGLEKGNHTVMVANFPEKKIQLIINPKKDIPGAKKHVKVTKLGNLSFGILGLIENFMQQNGTPYSADKGNFYRCDLDYEITFQEGKMIALELGLVEGTIIHEYRD